MCLLLRVRKAEPVEYTPRPVKISESKSNDVHLTNKVLSHREFL